MHARASSCIVLGKYKVELYQDSTESFVAQQGVGMHVEVKDPDKKQILSKYYTNEGQFVFTTHTPGEHYICLSPNSTRWFSGGSRLVSTSRNTRNIYFEMTITVALTLTQI